MAMMAVLKADAYGHGALMILPTLEASGVTMVGVAAMDEALQIRQAGFHLPVLVLGVTPDWAMHDGVLHDIQMTIASSRHLESLARVYAMTHRPAQVQIKVDTGMHRIGIPWEEAPHFINQCQQLPFLQVEGVFSHLAKTEDASFTCRQQTRWQTVLEQLDTLPPWRHIANSAGMWQYPMDNANMVRVGISLFGYPGDAVCRPPTTLYPAMGLKGRIVHLHTLASGEGVSYGQTFGNTTSQPRLLATLPLGYADGIPRRLSNYLVGLYQGCQVPQVGMITMDQLILDVTEAPDRHVGYVVTRGGEKVSHRVTLSDWAQRAGTIEYELMCQLRVRLPKTYVRESQPCPIPV
jgi:alanine racemase